MGESFNFSILSYLAVAVDRDVASDVRGGQDKIGEEPALGLRERTATSVGFVAWSIASLWRYI
jgi:hypothetical protein